MTAGTLRQQAFHDLTVGTESTFPNWIKCSFFLLLSAVTCSCRWKCSIFKVFYLKHVSETCKFPFLADWLAWCFRFVCKHLSLCAFYENAISPMSSVQYGPGGWFICNHNNRYHTLAPFTLSFFTSELGRCWQDVCRSLHHFCLQEHPLGDSAAHTDTSSPEAWKTHVLNEGVILWNSHFFWIGSSSDKLSHPPSLPGDLNQITFVFPDIFNQLFSPDTSLLMGHLN